MVERSLSGFHLIKITLFIDFFFFLETRRNCNSKPKLYSVALIKYSAMVDKNLEDFVHEFVGNMFVKNRMYIMKKLAHSIIRTLLYTIDLTSL